MNDKQRQLGRELFGHDEFDQIIKDALLDTKKLESKLNYKNLESGLIDEINNQIVEPLSDAVNQVIIALDDLSERIEKLEDDNKPVIATIQEDSQSGPALLEKSFQNLIFHQPQIKHKI